MVQKQQITSNQITQSFLSLSLYFFYFLYFSGFIGNKIPLMFNTFIPGIWYDGVWVFGIYNIQNIEYSGEVVCLVCLELG